MELLGKLTMIVLASMSLVAGALLAFDGMPTLGCLLIGVGFGLFWFVYWGLKYDHDQRGRDV